ncbi:hypothetical protein [Synechococcus phage S-M1]|uniref:Tape measure protein n=1 Tax=Synechococcus phage QB2 TaxID=3159453 RepID=A0AAU8EK77_9CAUD|nr:hypothetical protein [Synechococcus phage S-M1]
MAKLQVYKFVNPGSSSTKDPSVAAARSQTLAFNRIGSTVTSIGNVVSDIEKISIAQIKDAKKREQFERRRERRQKDAAAEELQETSKSKTTGKVRNLGGDVKNAAKKGLSWVDKFLGPITTTLVKLATFAIATEVLKWLGDPNNTEKLVTFLDKTKFVFEKIFGWAKGFTTNILDGISAMADPNGTFASRLGGLGKVMLGIIGLKYLMNPFSLISDILGIVDLLGRRGDRPPRVDRSKRVTQEATEQATRRTAKEATEQVTRRTGSELAERTGSQVFKYGGKNISRATHRLFLRIIGKGGVKGLKKIMSSVKIPFISGLISGIFNWIMGDSILESVFKGVGDGIGTFLGGWAGGAIGALGGPAAPITVPLGAFVGSLLGGLAGEAIGGYLYSLMMGKSNLGADIKALGGKIKSAAMKLWNEYIMNGDFWAGAWEAILNIGKDALSSAWGAMMNMWNYASGAAADFFAHMMEISKPWRQAMWTAFEKYVLNGPAELVKLITDTIFAGAKGIGKLFTEGAPIILQIVKIAFEEGIKWAMTKVGKLWNDLKSFNPAKIASATAEIVRMIGAPITFAGEVFNAIGKGVSKKVGEALAKAKEISEIIIEPIMGYIDPALKAISETWKIVSNFPGYVYDKGIKPIFDAITGVWNSGPAIWEFINRPNTFNELTGMGVAAEEDPQGLFLGGVVKGISKAVSGVGNAVKNVVSNPIVQTAASFIPGAAPIMAGVSAGLGLLSGNPMQMLGAAAGMIPGLGGALGGVGNAISGFMNSPLGNIGMNLLSGNLMGAATTGLGMLNPAMGQMAGSLLSGGLNPMNMLGNVAQQFGMGGLFKAVTGAMGGDYTAGINELGAQLGVDPKVLGAVENTASKVMGKDGFSAEYAMQQALEFVPVPMILEKIVPMPTAVPINTGGGGVITGTPSSLTQRTQ